MLDNYVTSLIRTYVPILAGVIVAFLAKYLGAEVDSTQLAVILTSVISGAYYTVFRYLEHLNPKFGWFLGKANAPTYLPPVNPNA